MNSPGTQQPWAPVDDLNALLEGIRGGKNDAKKAAVRQILEELAGSGLTLYRKRHTQPGDSKRWHYKIQRGDKMLTKQFQSWQEVENWCQSDNKADVAGGLGCHEQSQ